jgi:SAM-dependent methyltransferase
VEHWDERYSGESVWSGEPNGALAAEAGGLAPGRALDVGCGEGADAVWLAQAGWEVTALDLSPRAVHRTLAAADRAGVTVTGVPQGLLEADLPSAGFDLVSAMYPVLARTLDARAEDRLLDLVAPGGTLLFVHHEIDHDVAHEHGFDPEQLVGPAQVAAVLREQPQEWEILTDERRERHVEGGAGAGHTTDLVVRARRLGGADYDSFAAAYAAQNEKGLFNTWYNQPELLRLAGDVTGLDVLDAGCGSGPIMEALRERGARVRGFDLSPAMVQIARERLGQDADVRVGDLAEPLGYDDALFDLVVASLALHYVRDWAPTLAELRRVLRPGGRLLVSIIHPGIYPIVYPKADYFALTRYSEDYEFDGRTVWMTYWHRPLQDVLNAFVDAGFRITSVTEPRPAPDTPAELLPKPDGSAFLGFLFLALESS